MGFSSGVLCLGYLTPRAEHMCSSGFWVFGFCMCKRKPTLGVVVLCDPSAFGVYETHVKFKKKNSLAVMQSCPVYLQ